jgi:hypothetical protein
MHEGSSYKDKREFIIAFVYFCQQERAAKTILKPDLSELAACAVRGYIRLLKYFIQQSSCCPLLDKKISNIPTNSSPSGRNLSHFFAEYLLAKDYFSFSTVFNNHLDFLSTSDDNGNYSVNEFLRRLRYQPSLSDRDFAVLLQAVEVVVRRGDIDRLTFIRKARFYRESRSKSLFFHHLGFRREQLRKATGLPTDPPAMFGATKISTEFPIYAMPGDLLFLITKEISHSELSSIFCASKKCAELKSVLMQSSFWNEFFRAKGPYKYADYMNVPKELRGEYIDVQNRFDNRLTRGFLQEVIKSENKSELRAFDDNWIIGNSGLNSLELTNCWSPELTAEHIVRILFKFSILHLSTSHLEVRSWRRGVENITAFGARTKVVKR